MFLFIDDSCHMLHKQNGNILSQGFDYNHKICKVFTVDTEGYNRHLAIDEVCIVRMMTNTDNVESSLLTSIY